MSTKETRKLVNEIRLAIMDSLNRGNELLAIQQGVALAVAQKDHIEALEKELSARRLTDRYELGAA